MSTIRNLVFEGGGAAGVAYAGAIEALEILQNQSLFSFEDITRVAGTSVGSLIALMVSLEYSSKDIKYYLSNIKFENLKDDDFGIARDLNRLRTKYGFYKGEALLKIIQNFLEEKTGKSNATFGDLKQQGFKDLYIVTTKIFKRNDVGTCEPIIFSHENAWNTEVAPIVLASASIPGFYKRVRLKETKPGQFEVHNSEGHAFVDGGLFDNYAIDIFDEAVNLKEESEDLHCTKINYETLGFRLDTNAEIKDLRDHISQESPIIDGKPIAYFNALLNGLTIGQQNYRFKKTGDLNRTIFIDRLGVSATEFNLSPEKREQLIESGKNSVFKFFNRKELPASVNDKNVTLKKSTTVPSPTLLKTKSPQNDLFFQAPPKTQTQTNPEPSWWQRCQIL